MNLKPEKDDNQGNKLIHFLNYDFKNDERFQTGWQKLFRSQNFSEEERDQNYFKAKIFYYSKYFEPISSQEFMEWKEKEQNIEIPCLEDLTLEECSASAVLSNGKSEIEENIPENTDPSNITNTCIQTFSESHNKGDFQNTEKCEIQNAQNLNTSEDDIQNLECPVPCLASNTNKDDDKNSQSPVQCPKNFSDVMKLIQSGEPIPGIVHIDVKPTNTSETPSSRNRIKKPWE